MSQDKEFGLKTSQNLSMHDTFVLDGFPAQVIGFAGDWTLCEYIDTDPDLTLITLDLDQVQGYT
jgi:hypothetical protein